MKVPLDRREFLKLAGLGGIVLASGGASTFAGAKAGDEDFYFVQLSDSHWGFEGPPSIRTRKGRSRRRSRRSTACRARRISSCSPAT